jgi:hypothetical protein
MRRILGFPNPVNEKAARVVAAGVAVAALVTLVTGWHWLLVPIAYGFVARVLAGPRWSPLGRLATGVVAPRLGPPVLVGGPPKRFAQGMGAAVTLTAALLALAFDAPTAADVLLAAIAVFATLESVFAVCVGCRIFGVLLRLGLIPPEVCAACADVQARPTAG